MTGRHVIAPFLYALKMQKEPVHCTQPIARGDYFMCNLLSTVSDATMFARYQNSGDKKTAGLTIQRL